MRRCSAGVRVARLFIVGLVVAALAPAVASAGLLGTGQASSCDEASQPFAAWSDHANYILVPGGSFESGSPAWDLDGGARTVAGNEPFYVRSTSDRRSLLLPTGSQAESPTVCFKLGDWHARFFVRNVGSDSGRLAVDIRVRTLIGVLSILDGGRVGNDGYWEPSPRVSALVTNVGSLLGTRAVSFRLRPVGRGAAFQVDDFFLDPWKSR